MAPPSDRPACAADHSCTKNPEYSRRRADQIDIGAVERVDAGCGRTQLIDHVASEPHRTKALHRSVVPTRQHRLDPGVTEGKSAVLGIAHRQLRYVNLGQRAKARAKPSVPGSADSDGLSGTFGLPGFH